MNGGGFTIDQAVLADIGKGDAAAGTARLRLAIADLRMRKPVMGPTERPDNVRLAGRADEPEIEALLMTQVKEMGNAFGEPSLPDIQDILRVATREEGKGIIGVIEEGSEIVATIGLYFTKWAWTRNMRIGDQFLFVHPDHRKSRHASKLITFAKWTSDQLSDRMGYRVYLVLGITTTHDTDRKGRMMQKNANYFGGAFIYPHPDEAGAV